MKKYYYILSLLTIFISCSNSYNSELIDEITLNQKECENCITFETEKFILKFERKDVTVMLLRKIKHNLLRPGIIELYDSIRKSPNFSIKEKQYFSKRIDTILSGETYNGVFVENDSVVHVVDYNDLRNMFPELLEDLSFELLKEKKGIVISVKQNRKITSLNLFYLKTTYNEFEYLFVPNDTVLMERQTKYGL